MATPGHAKTGREQRRHSRTAKARAPDLSRFYRYKLPSITPGDFAFELELLRPRLPALRLDKWVDSLSWDDEQSMLTGSINLWRPDPEDPTSLPIARGHLVRCRVNWQGGRYLLWTMRCEAPQIAVDTGQVTVALKDDLALLDGGTRDWWFRKTKRRKHGYTADEIAQVVAAHGGVKLRMAAKGTDRFELKMRDATGLAVLKAAYMKEKDASGRSFIIRFRDGALEVVPLARNNLLYVLAGQIQTALLTTKGGRKVPTTVLTGKAHIGKGHGAKRISFTDYDRSVVRQFGYSPDTVKFGRVDSHAALRKLVRRELAKRLRLTDKITIQHQGIPFILRGDGVKIRLPAEGFSANQAFVFCTRATHTVQAGTYSTQWDFTRADPFLAAQNAEAKAAAERANKRTKRKRTKLKRHA